MKNKIIFKNFWNGFKEDFKDNKKSYIIFGVMGGIVYLILIGLSLLSVIGKHYVRFSIGSLGDYPFIASYAFFGYIEEVFSYLIPDFLSMLVFMFFLPFILGLIISIWIRFEIGKMPQKIGALTRNLIKVMFISALSCIIFLVISTLTSIDKLSVVSKLAKYLYRFIFYEVDLILIFILLIIVLHTKNNKRK